MDEAPARMGVLAGPLRQAPRLLNHHPAVVGKDDQAADDFGLRHDEGFVDRIGYGTGGQHFREGPSPFVESGAFHGQEGVGHRQRKDPPPGL